jgi:hypothetical protein
LDVVFRYVSRILARPVVNFKTAYLIRASGIFRSWEIMPPEYRRAYCKCLTKGKPHYFVYNGGLIKVML